MNRKELIQQIKEKQSFLCVGLDTDINKIPQCVIDEAKAQDGDDYVFRALCEFNALIIDATAPYCVAYKPNLAFYEAYGVDGILALTVAPYMGEDSVTPFLGYDGKWVILLALTSNKGSHDFQLTADAQGERLFEKVLKVSQQWGTPENMMFVVGATQGQMFEDIRRVAPDHFLLVPGVGAQGGSLQEVCRYGMTKDCGLLVNSSRGIIYASNGEDFAEAAASAAQKLQQEMAEELKSLND